MTRPPSPSARSLRPSRPKSRLIFEQCRTSGSGTKQLKSNATLTLTTPRNFSAPWKLFLVPLPRAAPHNCRLTGRRSTRTRRVSASAGRSTPALCWIGPRQLTQTPWIRSPKSPYEFRWQNFLPSRRSRRQSTRQSPAEHWERMASLLRSTRQQAPTPLGPSTMSYSLEEMMPDDLFDALIVSLYKKKRSKSYCGTYRGISLLSERSLHESSLTDSSPSLNRPSLRHSAASDLAISL